MVGILQQDCGGRTAIVGADEPGVAQWINRVVVAENDDDAIFCARKFRDDVADRELPFYGVGGKSVLFDLIAFLVVKKVAFEVLVFLAAHVAWAECVDLAGLLAVAFGIDMPECSGVECSRFRT